MEPPLPLSVLRQRQANRYKKTISVLILSELRHFSFGAKPFLRAPPETVETPKILYLGYNLRSLVCLFNFEYFAEFLKVYMRQMFFISITLLSVDEVNEKITLFYGIYAYVGFSGEM